MKPARTVRNKVARLLWNGARGKHFAFPRLWQGTSVTIPAPDESGGQSKGERVFTAQPKWKFF
jgi:hypothetical protein